MGTEFCSRYLQSWIFIMMYSNRLYARARPSLRGGWVLVLGCLMSHCAFAHTTLERYVRESIFVSVSAGNIDIQMQFDFPAYLSLAERQRMDRDGDGSLSKKEQGAYLNHLQTWVGPRLRLSVNGQSAELIPLADPILDLQDAIGVEAHPHELRLSYFARLPQTFGVNGTIALDSGLWTDMPLMISVSTEGTAGIRFHAADTQGLRQPLQEGAIFRITEARCTQWEPRTNTKGRK